jgi:XRE family transcriptional regulator, fatty acid utilization regulator
MSGDETDRWTERREFAHEIGRRIRVTRIARGMTVTELAQRVGMGQGQCSRTERGDYLPRLFTAARFARALGVPLSELVDDAMPGEDGNER